MCLGLEWERVAWRVGYMLREKERGRRKMTERARKWREWALTIRFDSERTPQKFRVGARVAMVREIGRGAKE